MTVEQIKIDRRADEIEENKMIKYQNKSNEVTGLTQKTIPTKNAFAYK